VRRDALARRIGRRLGYHVVRADVYSAIPDVESLPASTWSEPAPMPGVDLRIDESLTFFENELKPFIAEYAPPSRPPGTAHGYYADNPMYPRLDGEVLYAMVRFLRPRRIVEIGAGWSTRVVRDALARNDGETLHVVFDPDTGGAVQRAGDIPIRAIPAQQIERATFDDLEAGDLLFIDTTHTVKPGSDVLRLILEVLPTLAPGVVVHVHDFYRPFEYPRFLMANHGLYWQEHYLVQAFLALNDDFEVLIANHALGRLRPERVRAVIQSLPPGLTPGSALWLRRRTP
jgi:predicted O-methyltransferase YrrM